MKKLNKKGFTLIELLVVIVILVVIMAIAIPSVNSSIERSKEKQVTTKQKLIVSAAEIYADSHRNTLIFNEFNTANIYIKSLICEGLLTKEEAKDPFDESRTLCGYVNYNKTSKTFTWANGDCTSDNYVSMTGNITCP
jgi:prepilin-type N-terminal cleavage/methylation domain-containing protein